MAEFILKSIYSVKKLEFIKINLESEMILYFKKLQIDKNVQFDFDIY